MKAKVRRMVLCRNCKSYYRKTDDGGLCMLDAPVHIAVVPANHFCSYGKAPPQEQMGTQEMGGNHKW